MRVITYRRRAVALAGEAGIYLAPHIARLPDSDPRAGCVSHIIRYALDVEAGALPGEPPRYLPGRAERYVRAQLMPQEWFEALRDFPDSQLAKIFHVPHEQVVQRRHDWLTLSDG
jgi:hypothetical protein